MYDIFACNTYIYTYVCIYIYIYFQHYKSALSEKSVL